MKSPSATHCHVSMRLASASSAFCILPPTCFTHSLACSWLATAFCHYCFHLRGGRAKQALAPPPRNMFHFLMEETSARGDSSGITISPCFPLKADVTLEVTAVILLQWGNEHKDKKPGVVSDRMNRLKEPQFWCYHRVAAWEIAATGPLNSCYVRKARSLC